MKEKAHGVRERKESNVLFIIVGIIGGTRQQHSWQWRWTVSFVRHWSFNVINISYTLLVFFSSPLPVPHDTTFPRRRFFYCICAASHTAYCLLLHRDELEKPHIWLLNAHTYTYWFIDGQRVKKKERDISILAIVYYQRIDSFHIEIRYAICASDIR